MANYTGGPEWGRFKQETSPTTRFTDAFLTSFKEGMAYKLAQEQTKREEQRKQREQKALEEYRQVQMMFKDIEMKQQQEEAAIKQARLKEQWEAGAPERKVDVELKQKQLELMGEEPEMTPYQKAQVGLGYARLKKEEEPSPAGIKSPGLYSQVAGDIKRKIDEAYAKGDKDAFDALWKEIENKKDQMISISTNYAGQTERSNKDYTDISEYWRQHNAKWSGAGKVQMTTEEKGQTISPLNNAKIENAWNYAKKGDMSRINTLVKTYGDENVYKMLVKKYGQKAVDNL